MPIHFTHREKLLLKWLIHTGAIEPEDKAIMEIKIKKMLQEDGEGLVISPMPSFRN